MAFSEPSKIIEHAGISEGATVADLGAGSGFYSIAAAKLVGDHGKVYAVEIQKDLLDRFKSMAAAQNIKNIEVIHGDIEHPGGTRIKEHIIDLAIAGNVLFQIENKASFVSEVKRILKHGGRLLVVDWTGSFGGLGPHAGMVVTESTAKEIFEKAGFAFVSSIPAGDHHYGLIFRSS